MAEEFKSTKKNCEIVLKAALSSHGHGNLRNIHVSAITLMCELGWENFERILANEIIGPLQADMAAKKDNPGLQVQLKERINRLQDQGGHFKRYASAFRYHGNALTTLRDNAFDDELIDKALLDLNKVWQKVPVTKTFFITGYGNLDLLLTSLKNLDESVILNAAQCLQTLLAKEEGAQDLFIRHRGILILKACCLDFK